MIPRFVKKGVEKVKNSDLVSNDKSILKSLRTKLVYFTFLLWTYIIYKMPLENLKDVFIQVTFILSILVLLYVLGKKNIHLEMGIFKLDLSELEKREEDKNDGHNNSGNGLK